MKSPALQIGNIVKTPIAWFFWHYGIVCDIDEKGNPSIVTVERDKEFPVSRTAQEFSKGGEITTLPSSSHLPNHVVALRARQQLTQPFQYNLISNNCEHFCNEILGLPRISHQVTVFAVSAAVIGLYIFKKLRTA